MQLLKRERIVHSDQQFESVPDWKDSPKKRWCSKHSTRVSRVSLFADSELNYRRNYKLAWIPGILAFFSCWFCLPLLPRCTVASFMGTKTTYWNRRTRMLFCNFTFHSTFYRHSTCLSSLHLKRVSCLVLFVAFARKRFAQRGTIKKTLALKQKSNPRLLPPSQWRAHRSGRPCLPN